MKIAIRQNVKDGTFTVAATSADGTTIAKRGLASLTAVQAWMTANVRVPALANTASAPPAKG